MDEPISLTKKAHSALFWSSLDRFAQQGMQFAISVVLARLIAPADFGLLALVTVFIAITQTLMDAGFKGALIQRRELNEADCCTAFYTNLIFAIVFAALLCGAAPWVADYYGNQQITPILYVLSLGLVLHAPAIVQEALLTKEMNFRAQTAAVLPSMLISGGLGISWAYAGFGVWALVGSIISGRILNTLLLYRASSWRPSWIYSRKSFKNLWSYGSKMALSGVLETIFQNSYVLIIGKLYVPAQVAFYSRANSLATIPVANVQSIVERITFPLFSALQNDTERLRAAIKRAVHLISFIMFPIMIGNALVAPDLVPLLLGERWSPCVEMVQLLCVVGSLYCFHAINLTVLTAKGHSGLFLRLEILKKIVQASALIVTVWHGIHAMILGQIVSSIAALWINAHYTGKFIDYGLKTQLKDMSAYLFLSSSLAIAIWFFRFTFLPANCHNVGLFASGFIFICLYVIGARLFRLNGLSEALRLVPAKFSHFQLLAILRS